MTDLTISVHRGWYHFCTPQRKSLTKTKHHRFKEFIETIILDLTFLCAIHLILEPSKKVSFPILVRLSYDFEIRYYQIELLMNGRTLLSCGLMDVSK